MRMPESAATIRFEDGRYVAEIGAADLGTAAWTVLPQIAADALGVPAADVDVRLGDTLCRAETRTRVLSWCFCDR
jgi:xanthine dehydrogenase YagR molybdenum-binding subunit